ncbi:hypothetical protein QEG73_21980 [Chitinophagaceae bacterium 26-R-25]|nr:hypothetical protein [Chitinophagaceae bacterium 26-R-25]
MENEEIHMEIEHLEMKFNEVGQKVDKMYIALLGSDLTNDGGLVGRINGLEDEVEELRKQIEEEVDALENEIKKIKEASIKSELYVKILWGVGGAIALLIVRYFFEVISKH